MGAHLDRESITWLHPLTRWTGAARPDLIAGVTIATFLIPQVMAYAELIGIPPEAGIWAAIGALGLYAVAGSSPVLSVGPEATTALMTASVIGVAASAHDSPAAYAAILAVAVAVVCLLAWVARLSVLADLLSKPVLIGYMAGMALTIAVSQVGALIGVAEPEGSTWDRLRHVVEHLVDAQPVTACLGVVTVGFLMIGGHRFPRAPVALLGMLGVTVAASLPWLRGSGIAVVGPLPTGIPVPHLPHLTLDTLRVSLAPAFAIAFVGYSDNVLTARAFAARFGHRVDARRELLGLSLANLGAGVMGGFPVSSSGSRTAVGVAAGARTKIAGVVALVATVAGVLLFRPLLQAFPTTGLAAVMIYAATRLVDLSEFRRLGRVRRSELVIALATTVAVVAFGVLEAVVVAIGLSILDLLRRVARPHDAVLGFVPGLAGMHDVDDYPSARVEPGLMIYRYDSPLFFANAEDFRVRLLAAVDAAESPVRWLVLNTEAISELDFTGMDALEAVRVELESRGITLCLARLKQDLRTILDRSDVVARIGEDRVFPTLPSAVAAFREWAQNTPELTGESAEVESVREAGTPD